MYVFMAPFKRDFTRLESYFKIEILVKSCSFHELSKINKSKKQDCHFGMKNRTES